MPGREDWDTKSAVQSNEILSGGACSWVHPLKVDAPISRLSKSTALPVSDASALKDWTDKKLEVSLKSGPDLKDLISEATGGISTLLPLVPRKKTPLKRLWKK
ncbi:uncharacterized protein WCC33_000057 [Rhinophrynus dorsalis]